MTLLFFLRSPAGNTDTGQSPDIAPLWDSDDVDKPKRKKRLTTKEKRALKEELARLAMVATEDTIKEQKAKRKKEEEDLMMLFMHEFADYDD